MDMYDLRDELILEEFRQFQRKRDATMHPAYFSSNTDRPERITNHGNPQGSPSLDPINKSWSEYGPPHGSENINVQRGTYRGNPADYPSVGQPNGFIPNRGPSTAPAQLVPPTSGAMASLMFAIDRLHEKIRDLRSRLAPVLSPCGPDNGECAGGAIAQRSELTEGIMANARSIEGANAIIDDLLTRLEV